MKRPSVHNVDVHHTSIRPERIPPGVLFM